MAKGTALLAHGGGVRVAPRDDALPARREMNPRAQVLNPMTQTSDHHRRIEAVFSGTWPDRIPICEQAFASSVASQLLGRTVHVGSTDLHFEEAIAWLDGESAHQQFLDQVYADWVELQTLFDWDIMFAPWRKSERPSRRVDEHSIVYGDPDGAEWELYRFSPISRTFGRVASGRAEPTSEEVCDQMRRDIALGWEKACPPYVDPLLLRANSEFGNRYVVGAATGMAVPIEPAWLEATALDPQLLADWLDLHVERQIYELNFWHQRGVRLMSFGGDFAFKSGPIYSPAFFDQVMAPRWKRLYDHCRTLGMFCLMRSDGNLWPVAQKLFGWARPGGYYECDYDAGMRFDELRGAFPDLVLVGNLSCDLLVSGSVDEIRRRTTACIDAAAPRVVISSANSILHNTPVQNVLAMYETARSYDVVAARQRTV